MTYYPAANDLAEDFNKTIDKLLKKFILKSQRDWNENLSQCFWAYPHNGENPNKDHSIFLDVWMRNHTTTRYSNSISTYYLDNRDNTRG